jgi:predicted protein tyrosine phosphatase
MKIKVCSDRYAVVEIASGQYTAIISFGWALQPLPRDHLELMIADKTPLRSCDNAPLATGEQILSLIEFAKTLREESRLLIFSTKGRSRCSAAALIVQVARGVSESKALETLLAGCPKAHPNGWMLRLADAIMGTKLFGYCRRANIVKWEAKGQPEQTETAEA